MRLVFNNFSQGNPLSLLRSCGYAFDKQEGDEMSFMRRLSGYDYPRFHAYIRQEGDSLIINLHLDQKKPSYGTAAAHSGEYKGELVAAEAQRIKSIVKKQKTPGE